MADFRPETTVYLYRATGVDNGNQPYFTSEGAKMAWYSAHSPRVFTQYSYQRENREYIRVDAKAEDLRVYDMMGFQNSSGKWVLCRIDGVEFINPNCAEISYSVDYMQTYVENIEFGKCWVEREMALADWNGSVPSFNNLQPEGIETGVFTRTPLDTSRFEYNSFDLVVFSAYDEDGEENYNIRSNNNYPTGLNMIRFPIPEFGTIPRLSAMLQAYATKGIDLQNAIAAMFIIPSDYADGNEYDKTLPVPTPWPVVDGYQVKNAKCFTGEFFRLEISNRRGNEQELRLENFDTPSNMQLSISGRLAGGSGGTIVYPTAYQGHELDFGVIRYDDAQAPFVGNAFASWLAGNSTQMATNTLTGLAGGVITGALIGGGVGVAAGSVAALSAVLSSTSKITDKEKDPSAAGGQTAGNVMDIVLGNYGFSINWLHPHVENLKAIDEFFGWFGYRTNRFKKPHVNTRPKWNYVKTSNAICRGPFSKRAQDYMEQIMNNGVLFWHLGGGEEITDNWQLEDNLA